MEEWTGTYSNEFQVAIIQCHVPRNKLIPKYIEFLLLLLFSNVDIKWRNGKMLIAVNHRPLPRTNGMVEAFPSALKTDNAIMQLHAGRVSEWLTHKSLSLCLFKPSPWDAFINSNKVMIIWKFYFASGQATSYCAADRLLLMARMSCVDRRWILPQVSYN